MLCVRVLCAGCTVCACVVCCECLCCVRVLCVRLLFVRVLCVCVLRCVCDCAVCGCACAFECACVGGARLHYVIFSALSQKKYLQLHMSITVDKSIYCITKMPLSNQKEKLKGHTCV